MLFHHQIFCASVAIALTTAMASANGEANCIDSSSYRSPKLGLACVQHKDLDCREFGVVGYSKDDIDDLLRQCPSSCAVGGCTTATEIMDSHQNEDLQVSAQRSRSLRGPVTSKPSPGPTSAPVTNLPTASPVSDHPTAAPVTPEPSSSPVSDPPTASPVSDPPTALRHTSHPTVAPTTSSPSKIATESTSMSPSIESQDIQNVIAVAITGEENTQNQNGHSALDFLPRIRRLHIYGIIAAVAGMVIIVSPKVRLLLLARVFRTCKQFSTDVASTPRAEERAEARVEARSAEAAIAGDHAKRLKLLTGEAILAKHNLDVRNQQYKEVETHLKLYETYRTFMDPAEYAAGIRRNLNKLPDPAEVTGTINCRPPDIPLAPLPGDGGRIGDSLVDYPDNEEDLGDDDERTCPSSFGHC